jgi:hypothetical protein
VCLASDSHDKWNWLAQQKVEPIDVGLINCEALNSPSSSVQHWFFLFSCTCSSALHVSQPHFEKSVRMKLTLPKWELGSPSGLPKFQNLIAGVKTPRIVAFFISLESY